MKLKARHILAALLLVILFIPAEARKKDRYVIVVSMDGFRWDYPVMYDSPNIDAVAANGVSTAMRASYPASTFPNHYAIATGLVPDHNGLVNNSFWAPDQNDKYSIGGPNRSKGEYFLGEPVWLTAERQKVKTGIVYWVGSDVAIQGKHPRYWHDYSQPLLSYEERVDKVIEFLNMPRCKRPQLIMLYFDEPDHSGHSFGPESEEVREAVARVDAMIGRLREGIAASRVAGQVDLILLSDHGMTTISRDREIMLPEMPEEWIEHIIPGTPTSIFTAPGHREDVYNVLRDIEHVSLWRKEEIPSELQYGSSVRIGDIVVAPDLGWQITDKPKSGFGAHGYSPFESDMQPIFRAEGPDFKVGFHAVQFQNVSVYLLICHLLGITPAPSDGDLQEVLPLLK